jgi:hypothetical protein
VAPLSAAHAQSASLKRVSFHGITFSYDASLAGSVTAEIVPEQMADPSGTGSWMSHPEHIVFTFNGYAAPAHRYWEPAIYVFPIKSDYRYLNPGETHDVWLDTMDATRSLVAQKRQLDPYRYAEVATSGGMIEQIPFLPVVNAARAFVGKQRFLDFRNGSGFRCFTVIAQYPAPVTREETIYTFQGISNDGSYYVAATFPAFLTTPPASCPAPESAADEAACRRATIGAIEASGSSNFTPNLDKLDAIMESLSTTAASPGMPPTGRAEAAPASIALLAAIVALAAGLIARRSTASSL